MNYSVEKCQRPSSGESVLDELVYSGATPEVAAKLIQEARENPGKVQVYEGLLDVYGAPYAFYHDTQDFFDNLCDSGELDRAVAAAVKLEGHDAVTD